MLVMFATFAASFANCSCGAVVAARARERSGRAVAPLALSAAPHLYGCTRDAPPSRHSRPLPTRTAVADRRLAAADHRAQAARLPSPRGPQDVAARTPSAC